MKTLLQLGLLAALLATAHAQPAYLNYQGKLTDNDGQPLPSGTYTLEFNIYDAATAGTKVWGPFSCDDGGGNGHTARAIVANGRFNVILGSADTAIRPIQDVFTSSNRFLGISVITGSVTNTILPRQQFLTAPYAFQAGSVPDSGLSANVARRNTANTFTGTQTVTGAANITGTLTAGAVSTTGRVTAGELALPLTSLATSGFQELPGGLLMQWGTADCNIDESQLFPFPRPFGAKAYSLQISRIGPNTASPLCPEDWTATTFNINREDGLANTIPFTWIAIGPK